MIKTFSCKDTQDLFEGLSPRRFRAIQTLAERKLTQLDAAATLDFLRAPPGSRLEALQGDRKGQWSIPRERSIACLFQVRERRRV